MEYFKKGVYKPVNSSKYIGKADPVYRSSYELKFFRWADNNKNVIKWGSEALKIPYQSPVDGRVHHYYPDNIVRIKEGNKEQDYLIEIKPSTQTQPPKPGKKSQKRIVYEQVQFAVNIAKWQAAKNFCDRHKLKFTILTEKDLGITS